LRVALLTTHLALADVPRHISAARVDATCRILANDLQRLFGIDKPRIAVLGLNPHAGEAGQLGREEKDSIEPALKGLRLAGIDVRGPLPADSAFAPDALEQCDAVLAMYHDQGQIAMKTLGFERGVTVMGGLPYPVATPAQGTAFDIAGKGVANAEAIRRAFHVVAEMAARKR